MTDDTKTTEAPRGPLFVAIDRAHRLVAMHHACTDAGVQFVRSSLTPGPEFTVQLGLNGPATGFVSMDTSRGEVCLRLEALCCLDEQAPEAVALTYLRAGLRALEIMLAPPGEVVDAEFEQGPLEQDVLVSNAEEFAKQFGATAPAGAPPIRREFGPPGWRWDVQLRPGGMYRVFWSSEGAQVSGERFGRGDEATARLHGLDCAWRAALEAERRDRLVDLKAAESLADARANKLCAVADALFGERDGNVDEIPAEEFEAKIRELQAAARAVWIVRDEARKHAPAPHDEWTDRDAAEFVVGQLRQHREQVQAAKTFLCDVGDDERTPLLTLAAQVAQRAKAAHEKVERHDAMVRELGCAGQPERARNAIEILQNKAGSAEPLSSISAALSMSINSRPSEIADRALEHIAAIERLRAVLSMHPTATPDQIATEALSARKVVHQIRDALAVPEGESVVVAAQVHRDALQGIRAALGMPSAATPAEVEQTAIKRLSPAGSKARIWLDPDHVLVLRKFVERMDLSRRGMLGAAMSAGLVAERCESAADTLTHLLLGAEGG